MTIKLAFASDHAGFELKQSLVSFAIENGYSVLDFGTDSTESCDYPVIVPPVVEAIRKQSADFGVLVCGSGIGVDIVANRFRGMRSALCHKAEMAAGARSHNNANILSLGSKYISLEEAMQALLKFIETPFSKEERHVRRIGMIDTFM